MLNKFNKIFNILSSESQGKKEFVNRMSLFLDDITKGDHYSEYIDTFKGICFELGLNPADLEGPSFIRRPNFPKISELVRGDFNEALKITCALYSYFQKNGSDIICFEMDKAIPAIISYSTTDIGVRWIEGFFYPNNIPEVDHAVIHETVVWLVDFPAAKKDIQNALNSFSKGTSEELANVLASCYKALENVIQKKTNLTKPLHDNALHKALFQKIQVSDSWRLFLVKFIEYANEFGRHGKNPDRHNLDAEEVESYLYLSCIMVRMIILKTPSR